MAPPVTVLSDVAQAILDVVVARYGVEGVTLPDRRYRHAGEIAADCEQLVVSVVGHGLGIPTQEARFAVPPGLTVHQATLVVELWRCVTPPSRSGEPPAEADMDADGVTGATDGWLLHLAVLDAAQDETVQGACADVSVEAASSIGPEGGFVGWQVPVTVQIGSSAGGS